MRHTASITIHAPIESVFAWLADPRKRPATAAMTLEQLTPGPVGQGAVFRTTYANKPKALIATVEEFTPPERLTFRLDWSGQPPMREAFRLSPVPTGTRLTSESEWLGSPQLGWLNRVWFLIWRPVYEVGAWMGLRVIRQRIESSAAGPS